MVNTLQQRLLNNATVSNSILTSDGMDITQFSGFSVELEINGVGSLGTAELQASNTGRNWVTIGSSNQVVNHGAFFWNIPFLYHGQIRVVIESTNATTMTCSCYVVAKK